MRHIISCLLLATLTLSLFTHEASAARFGGGRSFGVQRSHSSYFSPKSTQGTSSFQQRSNTSKWGGMLGGLMVGGLLASLFMGHGLGAGIMSWLMLGALALIVMSFFKNKTQANFQAAGNNPFRQNEFNASSQFDNSASYHGTAATNVPQGFDEKAFLRSATVAFTRLQTAYDQKNLQDLLEFTAPDVFAEIKMQLDERGSEPNQTIVNHLNADLLDISKQANGTLASVRFTGDVKENNGPTTALNEIWHFRQYANNSNWLVAGIQQ